MKKFWMYIIRTLTVIGGVLAFRPIYEWFESRRSSAFNDWFLMDNPMGYNKPWDFGSTGSIIGTMFIIGIVLIFVFAATATTKDEKKWFYSSKLDTVRNIFPPVFFLLKSIFQNYHKIICIIQLQNYKNINLDTNGILCQRKKL